MGSRGSYVFIPISPSSWVHTQAPFIIVVTDVGADMLQVLIVTDRLQVAILCPQSRLELTTHQQRRGLFASPDFVLCRVSGDRQFDQHMDVLAPDGKDVDAVIQFGELLDKFAAEPGTKLARDDNRPLADGLRKAVKAGVFAQWRPVAIITG